MTINFSELRPQHSKLKKIQKFKDFSSKSEIKGLFKTVRTLSYSNERKYDRVRRLKEL